MKKDKGIPLPSPHKPADIHSDYLKIFQHVLTRNNITDFFITIINETTIRVLLRLCKKS